jgi:hypothetical protein
MTEICDKKGDGTPEDGIHGDILRDPLDDEHIQTNGWGNHTNLHGSNNNDAEPDGVKAEGFNYML